MHAWESVQKTLDYIEDNISDEIYIEELADIAALSIFYYQRLFTRLVKRPVREYIKLRRLARSCTSLTTKINGIIDIATEYGFGSRETFSRAFKETYGLSPSEYRDNPIGLDHFDKPNLLLDYIMVDEGVPLISEGIILEYHRKTLGTPVDFLGIQDTWRFQQGKMLGERPAISEPSVLWGKFSDVVDDIPCIPCGRRVGVYYKGNAPEGYATYFVGAEVDSATVKSLDTPFAHWQLPPREYIVCEYEAEDFEQLTSSLGKMMKFTRTWLKKHGLVADGFFPEIYFNSFSTSHAYMEMWIPFKERENNQ